MQRLHSLNATDTLPKYTMCKIKSVQLLGNVHLRADSDWLQPLIKTSKEAVRAGTQQRDYGVCQGQRRCFFRSVKTMFYSRLSLLVDERHERGLFRDYVKEQMKPDEIAETYDTDVFTTHKTTLMELVFIVQLRNSIAS